MRINMEPAQSRTIEFTIKTEDQAFYNQENQLVAEKGDFIIRLHINLIIQGLGSLPIIPS